MNKAGLRRAAVLIAGMHRSDRRWIRRQLGGGAWRALERALLELGHVAHADHLLVAQALSPVEVRPSAEPPSPDVLMAGLEGLPAEWASLVIEACAPDHRAMYESHLGHESGVPTDTSHATAPKEIPPALARSLAAAVRRRGQNAIAGAYS